jgi:hypothetical protein
MQHNELTAPTVRSEATVTVKETVDGTKRRKKASRGPKQAKKVVGQTLTLDDVDPRIAAAARAVRKRGQVFRVVSPVEVMVVNQ